MEDDPTGMKPDFCNIHDADKNDTFRVVKIPFGNEAMIHDDYDDDDGHESHTLLKNLHSHTLHSYYQRLIQEFYASKSSNWNK